MFGVGEVAHLRLPKMMTSKEVGALFGVSSQTVLTWTKRGRLGPAYRTLGGRLRLSQDHVMSLYRELNEG